MNALAAVAVGYELGVKGYVIAHALRNFEGINRRAQVLGGLPLAEGEVLLVDDYGHHPRELTATLKAIRQAWPDRRLVTVFQPHRYSRTRDLFEDFSQVLSETDVLVLSEVYASGESPIAGADGRSLARAVRSRGLVDPIFIENIEAIGGDAQGNIAGRRYCLDLGRGQYWHSGGCSARGVQKHSGATVGAY